MLGEESTSAVSAAPHVVSTIPPLGFYNTSTQLGSQIYSNENAYLVPRPLNLTNETSAVRTHLQSDLQRGSMISPLYAAVDYSKVTSTIIATRHNMKLRFLQCLEPH